MRLLPLLGLCLALSIGCKEYCSSSMPASDAAAGAGERTLTDPANTAINARDQNGATKTPIDQNENQKDIDITAGIRQRVVGADLSIDAHNVKIITQDGKVTLRGPVKSDEEKKQIESIAGDVAGAANVDSQLEVVK